MFEFLYLKMCAGYSAKKYYTTICQTKTGEVKCPGGQTIQFLYANYGRRHLLKCGIGLNVKCISVNSKTTVSETVEFSLMFSLAGGCFPAQGDLTTFC